MTRSVQTQAEEALHEVHRALDRLADNAAAFQRHTDWFDLDKMTERAEQIRRVYYRLDRQYLLREKLDIIKASRENTHAQES